MNESDEHRDLARELLDAEEAYRSTPTHQNSSRLVEAGRRSKAVLTVGVGR